MEQGMAVQAGCWEDLPPTSTTARKLLAGKVIRIFETLAAAANYLSSPNTGNTVLNIGIIIVNRQSCIYRTKLAPGNY
jgi:hypothetical protein